MNLIENMASEEDNLYITYVDIDGELLKVWGQRSRVGATYIERQLLQLVPKFNETKSPNPSNIHKGMFCFAKYADDNYYRARVISNVEGDSVYILFVDYGNKDFIKVSNIRVQEGNDGDVLAQMAEQAEEFYLARVREPNGGWSSEIIGEIRRDICYDEFYCIVITQAGDQKILEIKFQNEDYSDFLINKQLVRAISLTHQKEMVLTYCSLVSNDPYKSELNKENQNSDERFDGSKTNHGCVTRKSGRFIKKEKEKSQQMDHDKKNNSVLSAMQFTPLEQGNLAFNTSNKFNSPPEKITERNFNVSPSDALNKNPSTPVNSRFNTLVNNHLVNSVNQKNENSQQFSDCFNKEMVEALAKQIKEYIIEDKAKPKEQAIYHFVNNVLETGKTYNAFISYIDDGPWSFSVHLLSNENELKKITQELSSFELVNAKPPLVVGQPCVAVNKYNFCRGVIVGVSHTAVNVYFVDYGNTEALPVGLIFELPPQLFKTEVLSYKFCLHGMQNVGYSDDIKQFFNEAVKDKVLILQVASIGDDNLPTCDLFVNNINIKQILNNKMCNYKTSPLDLLNEREIQKVVVTWVISPQKFFVQLQKNEPDLRALKNELTEISVKGLPLTFQELYVGFKCICFFKSDGNWYRVVVTSLSSENVINVFYMDYGNSDTVDITQLRRYDSLGLITQMSPQAISCCLKGFENKPFDQEDTERLKDLIWVKNLDLTVASFHEDQICVHLTENGNNIALLMTAKPQRNFGSNIISEQNGESGWENSRNPGCIEMDSANHFTKKNISPVERGRNFQGEKTRKKNNNRDFSVNKKNKTHPGSTQGQFQKRNENLENTYENYQYFEDESQQNFIEAYNDQEPLETQNFGEEEPGTDYWREESFDERKKFEGDKDSRKRYDDTKSYGSYSERNFEKNYDGDFDHAKQFSNNQNLMRSKNDRDFRQDQWGKGDETRITKKWERNNRTEEGKRWDKSSGEEKRNRDSRWEKNDRFDRSNKYERGEKYEKSNRWEKNNKFDGRDFNERNNKWEGEKNRDRNIKWDKNDQTYRDSKEFRGNSFRSFQGNDKRTEETDNFRKPVRKDDLAPPGSKFEENTAKVGDCEEGLVTYYFSPHEFFIQSLVQEEEFKIMMQEIQTYYADKYCLRDPVQAGDIIIAQFSMDKILYRSEVVKPSPVTVHYVDYGNQEPINPKCIWPIDKKFLTLPKQILKCRLSNVQPIGNDWPPPGSEIDTFFEGQKYKFAVLDFKDGIYEISLENIATGKDVASELIAAGLAKRMAVKLDIPDIDYSLLPNQILRLCVSHVDCSNKFYVVLNPSAAKLIEDEIKAFTKNKSNIKALSESSIKHGVSCLTTEDDITWYRGVFIQKEDNSIGVWLKDNGRTIEFFTNKVAELPEHLEDLPVQAVECKLHENLESLVDEDDFKNTVINQNLLVSILSVNDNRLTVELYNAEGQKLNFQNVAAALESLDLISQLPIINQKMKIMVSHVESPNEIFIQLMDNWANLEALCKALNQFYFNADDLVEFEEEPESLVAAKSATYDSWYRGRIVASYGDELEIFYIDYGNQERLLRENIKKLAISFCKDIPAFARRVFLNVNYKEDLKQEIIQKIIELTDGKELLGYFINKDRKFFAELIYEGERLTSVLELGGLILKNEKDDFDELIHKEKATEPLAKDPAIQKIQDVNKTNDSRVFVTHIDSPKQFWVHKESINNDLHLFQDKLQQICDELPEKTNVKINDFVATKYSGMWYRGHVLDVEENNITVRFIDYGNILNLDLNCSSIKKINSEIINVPAFASCRSLKGEWNEEATSRFEAIILQQEDPVNELILEEGDPDIVELYLNGQSISEQLIKGCESIPDDENLPIVYVSHINSPDDFYIQKDSLNECLHELSAKLLDFENFEDVSFVQENEKYAAKFPDDGVWYRAKIIKNLPNGHEVMFTDFGNISVVTELKTLPLDIALIPDCAENCSLVFGRTTDEWSDAAKEKFMQYLNSVPLKMKLVAERPMKSIVRLYSENVDVSEELSIFCEPDNRSEFYISYATSPNDFYIQIVDDKNCLKIMECLENAEEFDELLVKSPGTICVALFEEDGMWYRAKVTQNLDEGCEVFFLDYGNVSVSTNLKKLPQELEKIPPRALKCRLDLIEKNIPESVKEEFINWTCDGSVFRVKFISQEDVNTVSLKLNGMILEKFLNLNFDLNETDILSSPWRIPRILEDETDDDKNSKINTSTDSYSHSNFEDVRAGGSILNETDEEKRVKIAIADGSSEGFKSDDEKNISESTVLSTTVNATDNQLIEEIQESNAETFEEPFEVEQEEEIAEETASDLENEIPLSETVDEIVNSEDKTENDSTEISSDVQDESRNSSGNAAEKIFSGSSSRDELEKELNKNVQANYRKITHSEKLVPGSISLGASLDLIPVENCSNKIARQISQSAPTTPRLSRHKEYLKVDQNDCIVPGCISGGIPVHSISAEKKLSPEDKNVSDLVSGSLPQN